MLGAVDFRRIAKPAEEDAPAMDLFHRVAQAAPLVR